MANAAPLTLTQAQMETLTAARDWWQEGEHSLDSLAEKARQEGLFARLRPLLDTLRTDPTAAHLAPILRLARTITANRALNRTRETDTFAGQVRDLLFGTATLPQRLTLFLQNRSIGAQTVSHLLYTAFPDRFPLVSAATRAIIAPSREQLAEARTRISTLYALPDETPRPVRDLLADFLLYETVRQTLNLPDFITLNAILWHAREKPHPSEVGSESRSGSAKRLQETGETYQTGTLPTSAPEINERDLIACIEGYIAAQGFTYPALTVRNYYVALKAKPFVLLTGLSGTGKTRLTRLFADSLTNTAPDQYLLLPVRPDWNDSTALLGYYNLLTDRYISTPFLDLLQRAAQPENRARTFFVCLDEMNLARVEHYFAEVLSAMETPERRLPLHENRAALLPTNVFLTGSINQDEATFPFSRKVLDRANTLEFSEVVLALPGETARPTVVPEIPPGERQRLFLNGRVETVALAQERLQAIKADLPAQLVGKLATLNDLLTPRNLHFGYRVRDEILRYVAASFTTEGQGMFHDDRATHIQTALDLQILQKILPRLSGTWESLERLLDAVRRWTESENLERSTVKLNRIQQRAREEGFVTFYET